jgi:hypothetical protein
MRTKSLLFTAALSAIGLSGVVGQVYSQNVVGYITLTVPKGLSIVANQLDNKSGNQLKDVIPALPDGSTIHFFEAGKYVSVSYFGGWEGADAAKPFALGAAAFLEIPADATDAARKITFVGEVAQKEASNGSIANGLSMVSSRTPRAGKLGTDLGFPRSVDGAFLYKYNTTTKNYDTFGTFGGEWDGAEPSVAVGEGFFFLNAGGSAVAWNQNFEVK